MRLPDFIIGGAPRSGTTWLYSALARHPRIHMATPVRPEPKFFLHDALYANGLAYYANTWFAQADDAQVVGEKSTNYLENAKVAARIQRALPAVRLVFVLRDPAARAVSNYHWSRRNGFETQSLARALELEPMRERALVPELRYARPHAYFSRGLYAQMLKPYLQRFAREQVLCLCYEELVRTPRDLLRNVHAYLGVRERPDDAHGLGVINGGDTYTVANDAMHELRRRYHEPNRALRELLGVGFAPWLDASA